MQYQIISRQIRIDDPVVLIVQKALLRSRVNNKCNVLLNDVFLCQLGSGIIVMEPRCLGIIATNSTYHYSGSLIPSNEEKLFVAESATKSRIRALLGATVFSRFVSIYCKFA